MNNVTLSELRLNDLKRQSANKPPDIQEQVCAFRALIRASGYLSDPEEEWDHKGLGGTLLDKELVSFCKPARVKRAKGFLIFSDHVHDSTRSTLPFNEPPVFITLQEREEFEDIANKTVAEIVSRINVLIASVIDEEFKQCFEEEFADEYVHNKGKKPVKADYLNFIYTNN